MTELTSIQDKRNMMKGIKKSKLIGNTVNSNWNNNSVYINDSLTQFNKNLFLKLELFVNRVTILPGLMIPKLLLKKMKISKLVLFMIRNFCPY